MILPRGWSLSLGALSFLMEMLELGGRLNVFELEPDPCLQIPATEPKIAFVVFLRRYQPGLTRSPHGTTTSPTLPVVRNAAFPCLIKGMHGRMKFGHNFAMAHEDGKLSMKKALPKCSH